MSTIGCSKAQRHYDLPPGHVLARKYEVLSRVGAGASGELYMLSERGTGIARTAKFFYPHLDPRNRVATRYALKLHKLRDCDILMPYRTQETVSLGGRDVTFLISDLVDGEPLKRFIARQPGGRLSTFEGLHLLHALALGVEKVHAIGECHGGLATDHVLVKRKGLRFQVKLIDIDPGQKRCHIRDDVYDLLRIFYEAIGGVRHYSKQPAPVKALCLGLRRPAIRERFRDAGALRQYLENMRWS